MRGSATSNSKATIRAAVAPSARSISSSAGAAGGAREEDHAVGVAGNVLEGPGDLRLAPAAPVGGRHRRPHSLVQLAAELLDERLLLLGDVDIALGDQHLAVPRLHAQEPHPGVIMPP